MTEAESNTGQAFAPSRALFLRLSLLLFTVAVLLIPTFIVWGMGGLRNGLGLCIALLALLLCLGVGGFVRWRARMGLKSFLVTVTILSIAFALVARVVVRIRTVGTAVKEVEKLGATVYLDLNTESDWFQSKSGIPFPTWARDLLGDAAFADVTGVDFTQLRVTDAEIKRVSASFPTIDRLGLYSADIRPGALASLDQFTELSSLELSLSNITDEELANVAKLKQLQWIGLHRCAKVTPQGMTALSKLPALRSLSFGGPLAGDASIAALGTQMNLSFISIRGGPKLTKTGVESLVRQAPRLTIVSFTSCAGLDSDAAIPLTRLTNLTHLDLRRSSVDDRLLEAFAEHETLKQISVRRTKVTWQGVRSLEAKRPKLAIQHSLVPPKQGAGAAK